MPRLKFSARSKYKNAQKVTDHANTYQDTTGEGAPDLITHTVTVNNRSTTLAKNVLTDRNVLTSPTGREVTYFYDPATLLTIRKQIPGLMETDYGYDPQGRLTSAVTGTRTVSFSYNAQGFMESATDPEGHVTSYNHDALGRVTAVHRPDTTSIFTYDPNGNMTVLTNPSGIDHGFRYNQVNLNDRYQSPLSGSYQYEFDRDRRLIRTTFPSGRQINYIYDTTRLSQIVTPDDTVNYSYLCGTKIGGIAKGSESIAYAYDGKLVTSETLSGTLNAALGYTYNNDFDVTEFSYAGGAETYAYDDDGLLIQAGNYTIARDVQNGLPMSVAGDSLNLGRTFNGYGEISGQNAAVGGSPLYSWDVTRDDSGRITARTETIDGVTNEFGYTYDPAGRLKQVTKDGTLVEEYGYENIPYGNLHLCDEPAAGS